MRQRPTRPALALGNGLVALTIVTGCGATQSTTVGQPATETATTSTASASTPTSTPEPVSALGGLDPCTLLTPALAAELAVEPAVLPFDQDSPTERSCTWNLADDPGGITALTNTEDDISQFRSTGDPKNIVTETTTGGKPSIQVLQPDFKACVLAVDLSGAQTLVVSSTQVRDVPVEDTCRRVSQFATAVLPNLP